MSCNLGEDIKCFKNVIFRVSLRRIEGDVDCFYWVINYRDVMETLLNFY